MPTHRVRLEVTVAITTTDEGEAGIDRYVDLTGPRRVVRRA